MATACPMLVRHTPNHTCPAPSMYNIRSYLPPVLLFDSPVRDDSRPSSFPPFAYPGAVLNQTTRVYAAGPGAARPSPFCAVKMQLGLFVEVTPALNAARFGVWSGNAPVICAVHEFGREYTPGRPFPDESAAGGLRPVMGSSNFQYSHGPSAFTSEV